MSYLCIESQTREKMINENQYYHRAIHNPDPENLCRGPCKHKILRYMD